MIVVHLVALSRRRIYQLRCLHAFLVSFSVQFAESAAISRFFSRSTTRRPSITNSLPRAMVWG
jgi:hypothetical protein